MSSPPPPPPSVTVRDPTGPLDWIVTIYACAVLVFLALMFVAAFRHRSHPVIKPHNPKMLMLMSFGAFIHTFAELISNRHFEDFMALERAACVWWGYWAAYVFGAGLFFVGLYMRLFTYTTAVSRGFTEHSAARARRWRIPVAITTMCPIVSIVVLMSMTTDAVVINDDTDDCEGQRGYKIAIGTWMSVCIMALMISLMAFRCGFVADVVGETRKQVFVTLMGIVVLFTQGFVIVFAEDGLHDIVNRSVATFAVATLYWWALGVMGAKPLWKVTRGDANYMRVQEEQLAALHMDIVSVPQLLQFVEHTDLHAAYTVYADFVAYCGEDMRPQMDRGADGVQHPFAISGMIGCLDSWTKRHYEQTDEAIPEWFPPLVCTDILRTAEELVRRFFDPNSTHFQNLRIPPEMMERVRAARAAGDPADMFVETLWWGINMLDEYYGHHYLTKDIGGRDIWVATDQSVRVMMRKVRREHGQRRLGSALDVRSDEVMAVRMDFERTEEEEDAANNAVELQEADDGVVSTPGSDADDEDVVTYVDGFDDFKDSDQTWVDAN